MGEKSALDIIAFDGVLTAQEAKASNDNVIINDKLIPIKSKSVSCWCLANKLT